MESTVQGSNCADSQQLPVLSDPYGPDSTTFADNTVTSDVYDVSINQMVPFLSNASASTDGPLPALGIEPALQQQLLDAIPPPSTNFPLGPMAMDEKGIPSALPGEFPLSLLPVEEEKTGGNESASVPLDKIEATINMNAKPVPTLTDAISLSPTQVNLIQSLPAQQSSPVATTTNPLEVSAQQQFDLNYSTQLEIQCSPNNGQTLYASPNQEQQSQQSVQLLPQPSEPTQEQESQQFAQLLVQPSEPTPEQQSQQFVQLLAQPTEQTPEQQTSPAPQQPIPQSHPLQTPQPLQPQQQQSVQQMINTSLINVPEVQLPPAPPPPSATSIAVFETTTNSLMSDMVQQTHGLPPPPPLQPVQSVSQSAMTPLPEMNSNLTNLVPVVEPTDQSIQQACRQPLTVVIKSEPQSYCESMAENSGERTVTLNKVNDTNNNPILNNMCRDIKAPVTSMAANHIVAPSLVNNQVRGYPLCVISTTPTTYMSKNNSTIVGPKHELTLPPKKAKQMTTALQTISSLPSKIITQSQAMPSTGIIYDLPQHPCAEHRVQAGFTQPSKLPHNMTAPFTTMSPILLSGLMPSVSVAIDGPIPLVKGVKDEKMRQLITTTSIANHPDYPAISGLLSFINPYHKPLTAASINAGQSSGAETPLSLSIKSYVTQPAITANPLTHSHSSAAHSSSHVPSLTRPSLHHNQSIMSATIVPTAPTAVPVSVVTSLVDHNRALTQRIKPFVGQNNSKIKTNVEHNNTTGSTGIKLQLAPLLSGDPAKPFQCALCGKHLASKNVYQLHLRSHSGEKPFTCNLCGHSFSQKTSLTRHMRSHTGERPFPCQVCGKRFADKERIKIHMRTHTGEKPFSCDICGKQFSQKSTVKRHMSVHTGEKPFKCETCGKGFANRGNLTAHTKTHSNS